MNKRKALADLYAVNPWLQDMVSFLEAQISTLADKNTTSRMEFDDLIEENEELEDKVISQDQELRIMQSKFASLTSRYHTLTIALAKLV